MKKIEINNSYVLDTSAILTLWNEEDGAETVENILRLNKNIYVSFMSLMECRYRLWKSVSKDLADDFSKYFSLLPIKRIDMTDSLLEKAIELKAKNNFSVCDSWIIATALITNSILVHKDPEFEQIKNMVKLKTLPYKPTKK